MSKDYFNNPEYLALRKKQKQAYKEKKDFPEESINKIKAFVIEFWVAEIERLEKLGSTEQVNHLKEVYRLP